MKKILKSQKIIITIIFILTLVIGLFIYKNLEGWKISKNKRDTFISETKDIYKITQEYETFYAEDLERSIQYEEKCKGDNSKGELYIKCIKDIIKQNLKYINGLSTKITSYPIAIGKLSFYKDPTKIISRDINKIILSWKSEGEKYCLAEANKNNTYSEKIYSLCLLSKTYLYINKLDKLDINMYVFTKDYLGEKNTTNFIMLESFEYESEIRPLPLVRSLKYILDNDDDVMDDKKDHFIKSVEEYGDIASRFLIPENGIMRVEEINIDNDEKPETVVHFCAYTANRCPHKIIITKDNNIIFSTTAGYRNLDIKKSENGLGFYIIWQTEENSKSEGVREFSHKTKFMKVDGEFSPVSEEYVAYVR